MPMMNLADRKKIARHLLADTDDSFFNDLSYEQLQGFYGAKCSCEVVPSTACCARDEARHILGEPLASRITIKALQKRR